MANNNNFWLDRVGKTKLGAVTEQVNVVGQSLISDTTGWVITYDSYKKYL